MENDFERKIPIGSKPKKLYGLAKVHRDQVFLRPVSVNSWHTKILLCEEPWKITEIIHSKNVFTRFMSNVKCATKLVAFAAIIDCNQLNFYQSNEIFKLITILLKNEYHLNLFKKKNYKFFLCLKELVYISNLQENIKAKFCSFNILLHIRLFTATVVIAISIKIFTLTSKAASIFKIFSTLEIFLL